MTAEEIDDRRMIIVVMVDGNENGNDNQSMIDDRRMIIVVMVDGNENGNDNQSMIADEKSMTGG
jgi:Mg-chelatase subunit ChlD